MVCVANTPTYSTGWGFGQRNYELHDHLGNVRAVISDTKNSSGNAQVTNYYNYYAFGSMIPGSSILLDGGGYRYGFNGQERDDNLNGGATSGMGVDYGFKFREYDARVGRWFSPDALADKYPFESPYMFAGDNPIYFADKGGEYKFSANDLKLYRQNYPMIMKYIETQLQKDILRSTKIMEAYRSIRKDKDISNTERYIKYLTSKDNGPRLEFKDEPGGDKGGTKESNGFYRVEEDIIELNAGKAADLENTLKSNVSYDVKQIAFMRFYMTVLHETAHKFNFPDQLIINGEDNNYNRENNGFIKVGEPGLLFEQRAWGTEKYKPYDLNINTGEGATKNKAGVVEDVINEANKTKEGSQSLPTVPSVMNN
ncbi:MAG: RHS repeat-associated core domain-containing protein [Flavipsychrobacter sp.]|nr:RHS repeat-associated core domain-containing protein [Flavipsychrobacter sp.]